MKAYKITGKLGDICSFVGGNEVKKGDMVYLHSESDMKQQCVAKPQENVMSIEAMKQALEALEHTSPLIDDVITAKASLRQAIEQAEKQEPVALKNGECWPEYVMEEWDYWRKQIADGDKGSAPRDWFEELAELKLVTAQPQREWVGTVDCIGLALDLEAQAKRVESQTVERAMLAAANGLRIIDKESKA